MQDDLVKITVRSEERPYSFTIDEYRILKRIPANASTHVRVPRPIGPGLSRSIVG